MFTALIEQIRNLLSGHSFPSLIQFSYLEGNREELSGYRWKPGAQLGSKEPGYLGLGSIYIAPNQA